MAKITETKIEKSFGIVTFLYLAFATLIYIFIGLFRIAEPYDVSFYHAIVTGIALILVIVIAIMRGWLE